MLKLTDHKAKGDVKNKMDGMTSINTPVMTNPFCTAMSACKGEGVICGSCYARTIAKRWKHVDGSYQYNADELTSENYKPSMINRSVVRIHAVGELINELHFRNLIKLVNYNPNTLFVMWTKRVNIVADVFKDTEKPSNLTLIRSSIVVNKEDTLPEHFDKVFTVYNAEYIRDNGTVINCQKQCKDCMICYTKNSIVQVNEQLR